MAYLSVLIPVYNGEKLVAQAIQSVLQQPCRDVEVVVVDDGSMDGTGAICKGICSIDSRVHYYRHENMGLGANRNYGLKLCKGEWIIFLDHDDLVVQGFYTDEMKSFLEIMDKNAVEMAVPSRLMANSSCDKAYFDTTRKSGVFEGASEASWWIEHEFASCIYSRKMLERNFLRFEETRPEMESVFRHKAAFLSRKVLFAPELFFSVRRSSPSQITKNWNMKDVSEVRLASYIELVNWHVDKAQGDADDEAVVRAMSEFFKVLCEYILIDPNRIIPKDISTGINSLPVKQVVKFASTYVSANLSNRFFLLIFCMQVAAIVTLPRKAIRRLRKAFEGRLNKPIDFYRIDADEQERILNRLMCDIQRC